MRRLALVSVLALLLVGAVVPAAAHVNHVSADPQVSADGEVVVETAYVAVDGWVVLHAAEDGGPGDPLGHTYIDAGFRRDVTVSVENWDGWNGSAVWAVLHRDDGDRTFEPGQDRPVRSFGSRTGTRIALERGPTAYVTARGFAAQPTADGTVTVRRVAMPADGRVVLRHDGRTVGARSLAAGTHENATVTLDRSFFRRQNGSFGLWAQVWTGGSVVQARGENVSTQFSVVRTDGENGTPTGDGSVVVTASPSASGAGTPSPTPTTGSGPGAGVAGAVAAVGIAVLALAGRKSL